MLGNWFKTTILMAAIVALFGVIGATLGGQSGMLLALLFAGGMNVWAYWFSDQAVLKMYNAREVDETSAPQFYRMVRELAHNAGLPMPRVYVIDEDQPNAFATGRNPEHAAVAATTGIMRVLSERELRGVMAHELAHVKHRDTLISTISATIAGAISAIAQFGMFFGGSHDGERNVQSGGGDPDHDHGADRRSPDPDGDFPLARIRGRSRRCGNFSRPACAGRRPGQDSPLCAGAAHADRRAAPGNGADDDYQPAFRRRHQEPVQHPPRY